MAEATVVDFKSKKGVNKASDQVMDSAKNATVAFIDESLDFDKKLPDVGDGKEVLCVMNDEEIDMLRQVTLLNQKLNKYMEQYEEEVEDNLRELLKDPEAISARLIKKALYEDIDRELVVGISKTKDLMDLLRQTMFWRIQERNDVYDHSLLICKGFKVVLKEPIHLMDLGTASNRLKKMHMLNELEDSNQPAHVKRMIRETIENMDVDDL